HVKMNTPGQHDGIVEGWLDGNLAYQNTQLRFRDVSTLGIDQFKFETFFGGSTSDFAPLTDEYAYYDDILVSTVRLSTQPQPTVVVAAVTTVPATATIVLPTATKVPAIATKIP